MLKKIIKRFVLLIPPFRHLIIQRDALISERDTLRHCVESVYPGDKIYYRNRPDVKHAVDEGLYPDGLEHFIQDGLAETIEREKSERDALKSERDTLRYCVESVYPGDKIYYKNRPDVKHAVDEGLYPNGLRHFIRFGLKESFENNIKSKKSNLLSFINGIGVDIGPLHQPFTVPFGTKVINVDRMTRTELTKQYPDLRKYDLVEPDLIDDAEKLSAIKDESLNFVIASHVIEHFQNPIRAIQNFLRIIKKDGVVILVVPDGRYTKDKLRPITTLKHVIKDYKNGPEWSKEMHFREYSEYVHRRYLKWIDADEEVENDIKSLIEKDYSIHFHVWTPMTFQEMIIYCRRYLDFPIETVLFQKYRDEFSLVMKKKTN